MIRLKPLLTEADTPNYATIENTRNGKTLADLLLKSKGYVNDDEAIAEAVFMAIAKFNVYDQVLKNLGQDPYKFVKSFMDTSKVYHKQSIDTSMAKLKQAKAASTKSKDTTAKPVAPAYDAGVRGDILWNVISSQGKSKNFTDIIPLDGGTVGIAHFAVGGLAGLYDTMDTQYYFGKSKQEMIDKYSNACRSSNCYGMDFWQTGMRKFVDDLNYAKNVQLKAWDQSKGIPISNLIASHGWTTDRQLAIALGIANSKGQSGFTKLADANGWNAEATLNAYVAEKDSGHRQRRKELIDKFYPKG
jgi:hypothetical protein